MGANLRVTKPPVRAEQSEGRTLRADSLMRKDLLCHNQYWFQRSSEVVQGQQVSLSSFEQLLGILTIAKSRRLEAEVFFS